MGRYLGWAHGTSRHPHGLVGPAGEAAVRQAILQSGRVVPLTPGAGEINRILNVRLPGALDSGGFMIPIVDGVPQAPVTVLMEVKNLRSWIYPSSQELFQVLYKGAVVQRAAPAQPIVPVLICRKAHTTTFWMAHQLGFIVIDMGVQFVGDVPATRLDEVRNERHFSDIRVGSGPSLRVRDRLSSDALLAKLPEIAEQWASTVNHPQLSAAIKQVRDARTSRARLRGVDELRSEAKLAGHRGGW